MPQLFRVPAYFGNPKRLTFRQVVAQFVEGLAGAGRVVVTGDDGLIHPSLTGARPISGQPGYTKVYRVYADMNSAEALNRQSAGWGTVFLTDDGTQSGLPLFINPQFTLTVAGQYGAQFSGNLSDHFQAEVRAARPFVGPMTPDRKAVFVGAITGGVSEFVNYQRNVAQSVAPQVLRNWTGVLTVYEGWLQGEDKSLVLDYDFTKTGGLLRGTALYNLWKNYLPSAYHDSLGIPRQWQQPSQVYVTGKGYPAHCPSNNVLVSNNHAPVGITGLAKSATPLNVNLVTIDDTAALKASQLMDNSGHDCLFSGVVYRVNGAGAIGGAAIIVTFNRAAKQVIPNASNAATAQFGASLYYRLTGPNVTLQTDGGVALAVLSASPTYQRVQVENFTPANQGTTTLRLSIPVEADIHFIGQQFEHHGSADFGRVTDLIPTTEANTTGQLRLQRDVSINHDPKPFRPFGTTAESASFAAGTIYTEVEFIEHAYDKTLLAWFSHNGEVAGGAETPLTVKVFALASGTLQAEVAIQGQAVQTFTVNQAANSGSIIKTAIAAGNGALAVSVSGQTFTVAAPQFLRYVSDQFEIARNDVAGNSHHYVRKWQFRDAALTAAQLNALTA